MKTNESNLLNRIHNRSVYLKDSIELTSHWIAVAGARYQHYEQSESSGSYSSLDYSNEGNKFLPQTGLIYKLTPDVPFYATMSKSFTPSTDTDDNGNVGTLQQGTIYEVGSKWQITPALMATAAIYRIDANNFSLFINGATYAVDKVRFSGLELEVNSEIYPDWDINANYSYDQADIIDDQNNSDNNGNRLQNAQEIQGPYI